MSTMSFDFLFNVLTIEISFGRTGLTNETPRKYAFLPCSHLDFETAVAAQNDAFKGSFDSSYSRLLNVKT